MDKWAVGSVVKNPYGFDALVLRCEYVSENKPELLVLWLVDNSLQICYPGWGDGDAQWEAVEQDLLKRGLNKFKVLWWKRQARKRFFWMKDI
jgi:hypothetical protein